MRDWQPIETAPKHDTIMLGKWSEDDQSWYWQASGCFVDGMWIDFTDDFHKPEFFHEPTHWKEMDILPPQPNQIPNINERGRE